MQQTIHPKKRKNEPSRALYHYCAMREIRPGEIQYFHGSTERSPTLKTNEDYLDFCERLASSLGVPVNHLTILSVNRL